MAQTSLGMAMVMDKATLEVGFKEVFKDDALKEDGEEMDSEFEDRDLMGKSLENLVEACFKSDLWSVPMEKLAKV